MEKFNDIQDFENYIKLKSGNIFDYCKEKGRLILTKEVTPELFAHGFLIIANEILDKFKFDQDNKQVINEISRYFTFDGDYVNKKAKGFILMGKTGSGKTMILKILSRYLNQYFYTDRQIQVIPSYRMVRKFHSQKYDYIDGILGRSIFVLDDMGSENLANDYGITTNVVLEYLYSAYDKGVTLLASTNLDPKSLREFYGERGYSRLKEMVYFFNLKGNDRR